MWKDNPEPVMNNYPLKMLKIHKKQRDGKIGENS